MTATKSKKRRMRLCPRRDKKAFGTELAALKYWSKLPHSIKSTNNVYRCMCGRYHLGRPRGTVAEQLQQLPLVKTR
jgi:hypothetical protein